MFSFPPSKALKQSAWKLTIYEHMLGHQQTIRLEPNVLVGPAESNIYGRTLAAMNNLWWHLWAIHSIEGISGLRVQAHTLTHAGREHMQVKLNFHNSFSSLIRPSDQLFGNSEEAKFRTLDSELRINHVKLNGELLMPHVRIIRPNNYYLRV